MHIMPCHNMHDMAVGQMFRAEVQVLQELQPCYSLSSFIAQYLRCLIIYI